MNHSARFIILSFILYILCKFCISYTNQTINCLIHIPEFINGIYAIQFNFINSINFFNILRTRFDTSNIIIQLVEIFFLFLINYIIIIDVLKYNSTDWKICLETLRTIDFSSVHATKHQYIIIIFSVLIYKLPINKTFFG